MMLMFCDDISTHLFMRRIYLDGINSPISWLGGEWHWPLACPHTLLYAVNTEQYISFAQRINDLMTYPSNGWEMTTYLLLLLFLPPYAEYFLLRRRLARAKVLLNTIATVRNPFFKSAQSCLRLSIAPDLTIAYVDILVDLDFHEKAMQTSSAGDRKNDTNTSITSKSDSKGRSLHHVNRLRRASFSSKRPIDMDFPPPGPLGQPKLPIFIRFCGMGTYFSPWYLDSNDLLLQAIPLSSDVSVFIDKAFINFIYDFNNILKSLRRHLLKDDLIVLLKVILFISTYCGIICFPVSLVAWSSFSAYVIMFALICVSVDVRLPVFLKNLLDEKWMGALGGLVVQV